MEFSDSLRKSKTAVFVCFSAHILEDLVFAFFSVEKQESNEKASVAASQLPLTSKPLVRENS